MKMCIFFLSHFFMHILFIQVAKVVFLICLFNKEVLK